MFDLTLTFDNGPEPDVTHTYAATGSYTGQVGIWDAATGKLIKQLVPVPVE